MTDLEEKVWAVTFATQYASCINHESNTGSLEERKERIFVKELTAVADSAVEKLRQREECSVDSNKDTKQKPVAWKAPRQDGRTMFTTDSDNANFWRSNGYSVTSLYNEPPSMFYNQEAAKKAYVDYLCELLGIPPLTHNPDDIRCVSVRSLSKHINYHLSTVTKL